MKRCGIYLIRNTISGRVYVGSAINVDARWHAHRSKLRKGTHHSHSLQRSWIKHGEQAFSFEILEIVDAKARLVEREQHWIDRYGACSPKIGFNMCPAAGSPRGFRHSLATRLLQSSQRKGGKLLSAEGRMAIGQAAAAKNRSAEMRAKVAAAKTALYQDPARVEQLRQMSIKHWQSEAALSVHSATHLGAKRSPEAKRRMSLARSGKTFGPLSEEHKAKLRRKRSPETIERMKAAWRVRRSLKAENVDADRIDLLGHDAVLADIRVL